MDATAQACTQRKVKQIQPPLIKVFRFQACARASSAQQMYVSGKKRLKKFTKYIHRVFATSSPCINPFIDSIEYPYLLQVLWMQSGNVVHEKNVQRMIMLCPGDSAQTQTDIRSKLLVNSQLYQTSLGKKKGCFTINRSGKAIQRASICLSSRDCVTGNALTEMVTNTTFNIRE